MIACATMLAIVECALFVFFVAGAHGLIVPLDQPGSTDFVSFHAAGALANLGTPWLAYDRAAHHAAEQAAAGAGIIYNYFYYPPVFLLLCAPLARLPYLVAFVLFQAVTASACFFAVRLIRRDLPAVVLLAFPGLWWTFGTGQNALLTAALFAAGTALVDRRPWLSGLCFGALCYKPHFGLLIPVALIAGGYWRAVLGAAAAVTGSIAASLAWFGLVTWREFLTTASGASDIYGGHAIFMSGLTSPYGVLMVLGFARETALEVQAIAVAAAAVLVAWVWRRRATPLAVRAAVLLAATPVAVPVMMFYDLMLVFVALAWLSLIPAGENAARYLAGENAARGWPFWRASATAGVFLAPLYSGNLSSDTHWLFAAATAAGALALTLTVVWREAGLPRLAESNPLTRAA